MFRKLFFTAIIALPTLTLANQVDVPHIDIFTTEKGVSNLRLSRLKQLTDMEINIHYVDAIINFENSLGGEIRFNRRPTKADIEHVKKSVTTKLNSAAFKEKKEKLQQGVISFQKAKRLNIEKIPAFVFEDKYIVYGGDAIRALKHYRHSVKAG